MKDLYRKVGSRNQLVTARRIRFCDGVADGVRAIELRNSNGLYTTCIEDLCMNLYDFSYKGINFAFQSKAGLVSNRFFSGGCGDFSHYWPAGLLYTCGLTNTGTAVSENSIFYPEHGRIGMLPAEHVTIEQTPDAVILRGTMRDSLLCGDDLHLHRIIRFPVNGKEIELWDEVENWEGTTAEFMLLYHCNLGHPLLDENAQVLLGQGETENRTPGGIPLADRYIVSAPRDDKNEIVWERYMKPDSQGYAAAAVINNALQLGFYIRYRTDTLPYLIHWNNLCAHDYCIGLEPSNCRSLGRVAERAGGTLPVLPPYGKQTFHLILGVLDGLDEIEGFQEYIGGTSI